MTPVDLNQKRYCVCGAIFGTNHDHEEARGGLRVLCPHGKVKSHWVACAHRSNDDVFAHLNCPDGPQEWCGGMHPISDADFASLGLVQRPVCGECEGRGLVESPPYEYHGVKMCHDDPCPSCGGTGFGRLVALDGIDVEALREDLAQYVAMRTLGDVADLLESGAAARIADVARKFLAAIDQEDTDGR